MTFLFCCDILNKRNIYTFIHNEISTSERVVDMKNSFKTVVLILAVLILFAACSPQESESFDVDFTVNNTGTDLEGITIKYMRETSGQVQTYTGVEEVLGYEVGTVLSDYAAARIKEVEKDLNCNFDITYFNGFSTGSVYDAFHLSNTTGDYFCDIMCGVSDRFRDDMKAGFLMGFSELDDFIDYRDEEKWGNRNILEVLYWEDDVYGIIPMLWPASSVSYTGPLVVNEDLIGTLNVTDPRDLYESGQWTWATFRDCLEKYYVQEGGEVKYYAMSASPWDMGSYYLLSNGFSLAEKGPDGNYRSGLNNVNVYKAMDEALDIYTGPLSYTCEFSSDVLVPVEAIKNDKAVMSLLHYSVYLTGTLVKDLTNFGILPWPSGPDVEPGYLATNHHNIERAIVIPRYSRDVESTAIALNALYEPLDEYPTAEAVKEFLYKTYFFDSRDADVYYGLYLNSQYSYFGTDTWHALGQWCENKILPSEYIESNLSKIEEHIEEEVAPSKRGIDSVWGE